MQAMACFEQAIARDASFALAHAGLASGYTALGVFGGPLRGDPRFGALLKKVGLDGVVPARS
jgi:hypothetical protein